MSTTTSPQPPPAPQSRPVDVPGRIVDSLVHAGLVPSTRAEEARVVVTQALGGRPPVRRGGARSRLAEIAGYAGGALVVAAIGLALASEWNNLSEGGQVATLGVLTLVLGVAGAVAAAVAGGTPELRSGRDDVRRRLTSALLTGAAVAGAFTVARTAELASDDFTWWPGFFGGLVAAALGCVAYRVAPSALAQLPVLGGVLVAVMTGLDLLTDGSNEIAIPALAYLAVGAGWAALAELGTLREPVVARFFGVALALGGAQLPAFDLAWLCYVLTVAVAAAGFVMYLRTVSWPYLVAGVLGITLVVPEAVTDWTDGSLGIAGGVLVAGLALLGASLAGLRVRREAVE